MSRETRNTQEPNNTRNTRQIKSVISNKEWKRHPEHKRKCKFTTETTKEE